MDSMDRSFSRTARLLGSPAMKKLSECRVAVFGVGGVGGYVVEALARGGIGALDIIDNDVVDITNINRQIIATRSTVGQYKVGVAAARIQDINPDCRVTAHRIFLLPETVGRFDFGDYDYVVDAIDTVAGKLCLIEAARQAGTPVICAMGAGNKLDPTGFEVTDIHKTSVDPLAKVIRRECKKRGIRNLKVVYSKETPLQPLPDPFELSPADTKSAPISPNTRETSAVFSQNPETATESQSKNQKSSAPPRRSSPGSTSFVPPVVGMIIAGEVIKDLTADERG